MSSCIGYFIAGFERLLNWLNSMYIVEGVSYAAFLIVIAVLNLVIANIVLVAKRD